MPEINWALMVACVALVARLPASDNLAAAYGIAVTGTMSITTLFFFGRARRIWHGRAGASLVTALFLFVDLAFFGANLIKFVAGRLVPARRRRRSSSPSWPRGGADAPSWAQRMRAE